VLCAAASALLLYDVAHLVQASTARPQSGIFVTTFGALAATALTMVLRRRALSFMTHSCRVEGCRIGARHHFPTSVE
jgi:hypothetical protein